MKKKKSNKKPKDSSPIEKIHSYDPLDRPVAKIPKIPPSFLIGEVLDWILSSHDIEIMQTSNSSSDQKIKSDCYPKDPEGETTILSWEDPLTKEDLLNYDSTFFISNNKPDDLRYFLSTVLATVKEKPSDFIMEYAKRKSIEGILSTNGYNGEITSIQQVVFLLDSFLKSEKKQLIPALTHVRDHCHVMSHDLNKAEALDKAVYENTYYQFCFSKKTSDAFTKSLIFILTERIGFLKSTLSLKNQKEEKKKTFILPGPTKEKCKEILKQLGYDKRTGANLKFGIAELIYLFNELSKTGFTNKYTAKSKIAMAISILTGYEFDEIYNRMAHVGKNKGVNSLFKDSKNHTIQLKLNKIISALEDITTSIESSRSDLS